MIECIKETINETATCALSGDLGGGGGGGGCSIYMPLYPPVPRICNLHTGTTALYRSAGGK